MGWPTHCRPYLRVIFEVWSSTWEMTLSLTISPPIFSWREGQRTELMPKNLSNVLVIYTYLFIVYPIRPEFCQTLLLIINVYSFTDGQITLHWTVEERRLNKGERNLDISTKFDPRTPWQSYNEDSKELVLKFWPSTKLTENFSNFRIGSISI